MKPLNIDKTACINTSSNCVIWQGPDIECIALCKGDTITDVIYKMAVELCVIMDTFDLTNYDLQCITTDPGDFKGLIQILIDKVCMVQSPSLMSASSFSTTLGNDIIVPINPIFYYTNPYGDLVTEMTVTNYVIAIGNTVGALVQNINVIQRTLFDQGVRITLLEEAPAPTIILPEVTPVCVLPKEPTEMNIVIAAVEQQFCELQVATGNPTAIYTNIQKQLSGLNQAQTLSGTGGTMASLPGWTSTIQNQADVIGNLLVAYQDMRSAVINILDNYIPSICSSINLVLFATYNSSTTSVVITVSGTVPATFVNTNNFGTTFTITDTTGASTTINIDILQILNNINGITVSLLNTPINGLLNLKVSGSPNFTSTTGSSQCQSYLEYNIVNQGSCPAVTYTPNVDHIVYSFTSSAATQTYIIEIWNASESVLIASQSVPSNSVTTITNNFSGLAPGTMYKLRVTINIAGVTTTCAFTAVTTI